MIQARRPRGEANDRYAVASIIHQNGRAAIAPGAPMFTANAITGAYTVSATASGVATPTSFSLTNTSDNPVQATVARQDWDRIENGDNRFMPAGSSGTSCVWGPS